MSANDIQTYSQGIRFSDESALFYDVPSKVFKDQSPFSAFDNDLTIVAGTPNFVTEGINNRKGLYLDNTCHGDFFLPNAWEGSMIVVLSTNAITGTTNYNRVYTGGDAASTTSNAHVETLHFSGTRRLYTTSEAGQLKSLNDIINTDEIRIFAFAYDQETRKAYSTVDGITVGESNAYTANSAHGKYVAMGGGIKERVGQISGVIDGVVVNNDLNTTVFEHHCYTGNILLDDLPAVKTFIDELKVYYGIT